MQALRSGCKNFRFCSWKYLVSDDQIPGIGKSWEQAWESCQIIGVYDCLFCAHEPCQTLLQIAQNSSLYIFEAAKLERLL